MFVSIPQSFVLWKCQSSTLSLKWGVVVVLWFTLFAFEGFFEFYIF